MQRVLAVTYRRLRWSWAYQHQAPRRLHRLHYVVVSVSKSDRRICISERRERGGIQRSRGLTPRRRPPVDVIGYRARGRAA